MFDIISKDALRTQVEAASDNKVTVLYDDKGYPSMMAVIPKMTIGDVFPTGAGDEQMDAFASEVHPAFKIYDSEGHWVKNVPEIFIAQYKSYVVGNAEGNSWANARAISIPGVVPSYLSYYNSTYSEYQQRVTVENKGPNWHQTNVWEYYLLAFWAYKNNILIQGNQNGVGGDYDGRTGVVGRWQLTLTPPVISPWTIGETVVGSTSGASGVVVSEIVSGLSTQLEIRDVYVGTFQLGETITGMTSGLSRTLSGVVGITYEGSGPMTWTHNNKYSGVWGMCSNRELLDGLRLRKKPAVDGGGNPTGNYHPMMISTPGNYYHWDDSRFQSYPVKMSYDTGTGAHRLGYQPIDSSGNPIDPSTADPSINMAAYTGSLSSWLPPSTLYKDPTLPRKVSADTRKLFTCMLWDKAVISDSDKVSRDAEGGRINPMPTGEIDMMHTASTPWGTDYNGVFSYVYVTRTQQTQFRITYIPD